MSDAAHHSSPMDIFIKRPIIAVVISLALIVIGCLVKGLIPALALMAGFL